MSREQFDQVCRWIATGYSWKQIAEFEKRPSAEAARSAYRRAVGKYADSRESGAVQSSQEAPSDEAPVSHDELREAETVEDLLRRLGERSEGWEAEVVSVGGSEWDMANGKKGRSLRVKGTYRRQAMTSDDLDKIWEDIKEDIALESASHRAPVPYDGLCDEPLLAVVAINDAHFGMLAHGDETGKGHYDLDIARQTFEGAVIGLGHHLLRYRTFAGSRQSVQRILFLVGNDLFHANSYTPGGKQPVTRAGTPQDVDTRLHEVFTTARRTVTWAIDELARWGADIDVVMVPGNHDVDEVYRLGEVLEAWYRKDAQVSVANSANKRKFYGFGKNALMLTHGEEFKRQRDNLAMIMLNEMPGQMLLDSRDGLREVLTGHNHAAMSGGYFPTAGLTESQGVRVRSLPGLTGIDAWHHEEGYRHHRAATLLVYQESGGLYALHEVTP